MIMKKILVLIIVVLIASPFAWSQEEEKIDVPGIYQD